MNEIEGKLVCRLCGIKSEDQHYIHIFDGTVDLKQTIKELLSVSVSETDTSKYICLSCHDKLTKYNQFIKDSLRHEKEFKRTTRLTNTLQTENDETERIDGSIKNVSDAIYNCPNCDVGLVILLVSDPQESEDSDFSFQISLAIADKEDKFQDIEFKSLKNGSKEYSECQEITDENCENNTESLDTVTSEETPIIQFNDNRMKPAKRKFEEIDENLDPIRIITPNDEEFMNYECIESGNLIKIESIDNNIVWTNSETEEMLTVESIQDNELKNEENYIYRPSPKITCELCGSRYVSSSKYEFHMERHKTGEMDKFVCPVCKREASTENLLWDHYFHTHKNSQRFACVQCDKLFTKRSRLKGHQMKNKHSGEKIVHIDVDQTDDNSSKSVRIDEQGVLTANCHLCGILITDLDPDAINDLVTCPSCDDSTLSLVVDGNEAKVISPRQYHCSKCPKHFLRKERLEFHEMRHNENMNEFVCSTCGKDFRAENSLYEHYLFVHKGARPHICELCGKSFQLKARLKEHHRTHTGERPFQCDICGQRCMTSNALKLHRKIHFSYNRHTCNICHKTFSKKQNMNEHLEKHWKTDRNVVLPHVFTCPICSEDFPTYRMLKYHMIEIHQINNQDPLLTRQRPWYECADCHEKFQHQMSLKAHREKVHEGKINPMYQCDVCNATYRIKQLLINHIKSKHSGEKRYKCAQCEKGFNDTKSLYNHVLLHTGKKPYICEYCNMAFRRKDSKDHHQRKHTGEQPYQCADCGESFSTYNNRSKHRKKQHGEGEIECMECGEKFNGQQDIRVHLNKHLGEKLEKLDNV